MPERRRLDFVCPGFDLLLMKNLGKMPQADIPMDTFNQGSHYLTKITQDKEAHRMYLKR